MRLVLLALVLVSFVVVLVGWWVARAAERRNEKIIERQVVVTRCSFCSAMRPIDLSTCPSCGARVKA